MEYKLLLEGPKGSHSCLIEVSFPILFCIYFGALITGHLIEGGCLMEGQL